MVRGTWQRWTIALGLALAAAGCAKSGEFVCIPCNLDDDCAAGAFCRKRYCVSPGEDPTRCPARTSGTDSSSGSASGGASTGSGSSTGGSSTASSSDSSASSSSSASSAGSASGSSSGSSGSSSASSSSSGGSTGTTCTAVPEGTPCGDATESDCNRADSCQGPGVCASNLEVDGTGCMDCPAGPGQCEACASGACQSSTCPSTPPASLNTGFPTGNTGAGNMFDVVASADVMVNTITVLPAATGPSTFEVWTTDDGIAGKLDDAGAWSAHAPINVDVTAVAPLALPVDLAIPIAAGTTKGFYVTEAHYDDGGGSAAGAKLKYATSATAVGTPAAADSALTIDVGYGTVYPFGQTFAQRTWSGAISYTPTLTTGTWSATKLAQGITFDITALSDVRISNIGLHVGSNVNHTVNVYVRAGSYAGFENDATAWHQVASARLPGFAPRVPIDPGVVIPAGQTYGFYVMMPGTPLIYAYTATAAGTLLGANNLITITAGQSELGTFGGNDGNGGLDGTVAVAPCP